MLKQPCNTWTTKMKQRYYPIFRSLSSLTISLLFVNIDNTKLIYIPGKKYCNTKFETEYFSLDRQFQYIFYIRVAI